MSEMTQEEKRIFLIRWLLDEQPQYRDAVIPEDAGEQKRLLRGLMNVRQAKPVSDKFLKVQDEYLKEVAAEKGATRLVDIKPASDNLYLWQGDITTMSCGAIVNAANSGMTGCYCPCHGCIDNAIHTYAGVQLRLECAEIMEKQGYPEPTGRAKITGAYNLPCSYVIHTVGPIVNATVTRPDEEMLESCYRSCLELAERSGLASIAFCCISTGEFHFPNERAARIAIKTVHEHIQRTNSKIKVVFNVYKDEDYKIYRHLLREHKQTQG
jgi:O-acetyl-ADP-ribose deacetylase (regulator of RNase III)